MSYLKNHVPPPLVITQYIPPVPKLSLKCGRNLSQSSPTTEIFDDLGDLKLEVGNNGHSCLVCSRSLARASPVFKAMLYGGYAESKPAAGDWIVRLPEEDPVALSVIMNLIHGHHDKIPSRLEDLHVEFPESDLLGETVLYQVAVIADKYFLLPVFRHYINTWFEPWKWGETAWQGEVFTAAWVFGEFDIIQKQVEDMVRSTRFRGKTHKGRAWVRNFWTDEWRLGGMPDGPNKVFDNEGFSELILQTRERLILDMAKPFQDIFNDPNQCMDGLCHSPGINEVIAPFRTTLKVAADQVNSRRWNKLRPWLTKEVKAYKGTVVELHNHLCELVQVFTDGFRPVMLSMYGDSSLDVEVYIQQVALKLAPTWAHSQISWPGEMGIKFTRQHMNHIRARKRLLGEVSTNEDTEIETEEWKKSDSAAFFW